MYVFLFYFILTLFNWSIIDGLPNIVNKLKTNSKDGDEYAKRLKHIRDIFQTMGFPGASSENRLEDGSRSNEQLRQSIDTDFVKRLLLPTRSNNQDEGDDDDLAGNDKEMVFVWKMEELAKKCENTPTIKTLELQFLFNLKLFERSELSKASIYFYKKKQTPTEQILVKEIPNVGTHEYLINSATFSNQGGWVQLDITHHVDYWSSDYGISELRTLRLECVDECTELYVEHCQTKELPFLYITLKPKQNVEEK